MTICKSEWTEFESLVNRYYDPSTDQFLTVDPDVAETGQPYAYAGDDPLNATDPLGLISAGTVCGQRGTDTRACRGSVKIQKEVTLSECHRGSADCGNGSFLDVVEAVGRFVKTHKVAVGIALGALSVVTGGASLYLDAGLIGAGGAGVASIGTGLGAVAIDNGACHAGNSAACVGRDLGGAGIIGSGLGLPASFGAGGILGAASYGAAGFGFNLGLASLVFDLSAR